MKSEHLGIGDRVFLINRLIQQAPINTLIREFFKNADENAALAPKGKRWVQILPTQIDGVRKLTFKNSGIGMSHSELRKATDISSSVSKEMSLDGNFGIGAKVSGLAASPYGIRYRSCKAGEVHEVTIGYDDIEKTYVRFSVEMGDGSFQTIYEVTNVVKGEGAKTDSDWTEVVLFGQSADHDTVAEPIGKGQLVDRSFIATSIFRRFAKFSPGVEVTIDVAMTKGGGKEETGRYRALKTLNDVLNKLGRHEVVKHLESGVSIRYIHDPRHEVSGHTASSRANSATGSTTFCALVYKDERYDFRTQKVWSSVAPVFGIPFGSKVLTVEIYVPDAMALPNQYRDALTHRSDRSVLSADQFASLVREMMPEWVKDIIIQESPDTANDLKDLQADLQAILDDLRVPTTVLKRSQQSPFRANPSDTGISRPEQILIEAEQEEDNLPVIDPRRRPADRSSKSNVRIAPIGAVPSKFARALERAPDIKILVDPADINEREMKGKAARFYQDVQTLFVNGLYPIVERMAQELADDHSLDKSDPDEQRRFAIQAAQRSLAFRVGKATCFALAKRMVDDWSQADMERATSPESLSIAADDYRQSISSAKKWIRDQQRVAMAAAMT